MKNTYVILGLATVLMMTTAPMASAAELKKTTTTNTQGIIDFNALDTDRDGTLTETEFNANSSFKGNSFGDVDKNDDGTISSEELSTWTRVNGKGNAVGSSNSVSGTVTTNTGAGAAISTKGTVPGTPDHHTPSSTN